MNASRIMYKLSFSNARWATGLSSFDKSSLEDAIERGHVAGHAQKSGIELPKIKKDYITEELIETITPQDLLAKKIFKKLTCLQLILKDMILKLSSFLTFVH